MNFQKSTKKKVQPLYIFGRNVIEELLQVFPPTVIKQVFVLKGSEGEYKKMFPKTMRLQPVHISTLDKHSGKSAHQGIVVELYNFPYKTLDEVFTHIFKKSSATILALDHVTDPQNFGAIIRSAAAFGCDAILIEDTAQVPVNGTVIKTSVGTAFKIPIIRVPSLLSTLLQIKNKGFTVYGFDAGGESITEKGFTFHKRSLFIFGSEGHGMRMQIKESVDTIVSIPMRKDIESLSVSAAAAVACFERAKQVDRSST